MTSSAIWSLAFGLIAMLLIIALGLGAKRTLAIGVLLIMIPFQVVDTRYGSSSVLMAYALAAVLIVAGDFKLRMLPALGLIVLGYFMSLAMDARTDLVMNAIEIIQFFSAFVVFLLAYNFARLVKSERTIVDVLLVVNLLVIGYCLLQFTVGPGERFTPFGIDSLAFNQNRTPDDPRLIGAFGNPGTTAGYFTLMTFVCACEYMFVRGRRKFLVQLIIGMNLLGLVATGNRTGFLILLAMFPLFVYVFRRELGAKRIATYAIGGAIALALASMVAIYQTDFGRMFKRMETVTETKSGLPSTRSKTWPAAVVKIKRDPWFGEGPYYPKGQALAKSGEMRVTYEDLESLTTAFDPYPHSMYLYVWRTAGIVGLIPLVAFFLWVWRVLYVGAAREQADRYRSSLIRLGFLLIPAFLIGQITLEFNRTETMDYAQFIFALMGLLVGISDRSLAMAAEPRPAPAFGDELARIGGGQSAARQ